MEKGAGEIEILNNPEIAAGTFKTVNFQIESNSVAYSQKGEFETDFDDGASKSADSLTEDSTNVTEESSEPPFEEEELEIPVSISGIHAKTLSDHESMQLSSSLRVQNSEFNQHLKELFYAGVAPSRFNLARQSAGKYVTRFFRPHKWKTQRSKYLWQRIRIYVLGDKAPEDEDDEDEEENANYKTKLSQGFKLEISFKRPNEITAIVHNPKLPGKFWTICCKG